MPPKTSNSSTACSAASSAQWRDVLPRASVVRPTIAHEVMPVNAARYGVRPLTRMADQEHERDQRRPARAQRLAQPRHLGLGQAAQPEALGLEVHLHEHAEEVHEGRDDRGRR